MYLGIYKCPHEDKIFEARSSSLKDVFEIIKTEVRDDYNCEDSWDPEEVEYFKGDLVKVEYTLVEVVVPTPIKAAVPVKAATKVGSKKR
jgi:hypothetical protein